MTWRSTVVSLVAVVVLLASGSAHASSVSGGRGFVTFSAQPGEANDVHIGSGSSSDHLLVRDSGAALEALSGCVAIDAHTADCTVGPSVGRLNASLRLDDGNDRAVVDPPTWSLIDGGAGDDQLTGCELLGGDGNDALTGCDGGVVLTGGAGDDLLEGGNGNDNLDGGMGRDTLHGGPGDDVLLSAVNYYETTADYLDGGAGRDDLSYGTGRTSTVDLAAGTVRRDDGDVGTVVGIENVYTGPGDNVVLGDAGDNLIDAGPGADLVDGRGGDDVIVDREGADTLRGGSGDDRILSGDLYRDSVDCGDGADRLAADRGDVSSPSCEARLVMAPSVIPTQRLRVHDGRIRIPTRCSYEVREFEVVTEGLGTCALRLTLWLRLGSREVVAGRSTCVNPFQCDYDMQLSRRARAALRRRTASGTIEVLRSIGTGALPMRQRVTVVRSH